MAREERRAQPDCTWEGCLAWRYGSEAVTGATREEERREAKGGGMLLFFDYIVILKTDGTYACGCPRWCTHVPREDCKHIRSLKATLARMTIEISEPRVLDPEKIRKMLSRFALVEVE